MRATAARSTGAEPVDRSLSGISMFAITCARERELGRAAGVGAEATGVATAGRVATGSDGTCGAGLGCGRVSDNAGAGRGDAGRDAGGVGCWIEDGAPVATGFAPDVPP